MKGYDALKYGFEGYSLTHHGGSPLSYQPDIHQFVHTDGTVCQDVKDLNSLSQDVWAIDFCHSLSFLEADAAMRVGHIVRFRGKRYRIRPISEYYQCQNPSTEQWQKANIQPAMVSGRWTMDAPPLLSPASTTHDPVQSV